MKVEVIVYDLEDELKNLVEFAEANPFSMDYMLDVYNGYEPGAADKEGHYVVTPFGMKIAYCIENQLRGKTKHLEVSMDKDCAFPPPMLTKEVMKIIGFETKLEECFMHIRKFDDKRGAINIWDFDKNE